MVTTMNINVRYYGQARSIARVDSEIVCIDEAGLIRDVIAAVSARHGEAMQDLLCSADGLPRRSVLAPVNGKVVGSDGPGVLKEADEIAIHTPIAGG